MHIVVHILHCYSWQLLGSAVYLEQQQQYHFAGPMADIPTDFVYVLLEQRVPIAWAPFPQFADVGVYECINVVVVPLYIL